MYLYVYISITLKTEPVSIILFSVYFNYENYNLCNYAPPPPFTSLKKKKKKKCEIIPNALFISF